MELPVISAEHLAKEFNGAAVLVDVSFEVPGGSLFAFAGPRDAGKTTMVRLLTGMYEPTEGSLSVLGESPQHFTDSARGRIGYMPQGCALYPQLTVWENLHFRASLFGAGPFRRRKRFRRILELLGLEECKKEIVGNLSQDFRRRLSLGACLVQEPELLLLDEPTAGLGQTSAETFWSYLVKLRSEGRTIFVTTENAGTAACCDHIGVMSEGHLKVVDSPDGFRRRAFGGEMVDIVSEAFDISHHLQPLMELPFVKAKPRLLPDGRIRLIVDDGVGAIAALTRWCSQRNIPVRSVERFIPGVEAAFTKLNQTSNAEPVSLSGTHPRSL